VRLKKRKKKCLKKTIIQSGQPQNRSEPNIIHYAVELDEAEVRLKKSKKNYLRKMISQSGQPHTQPELNVIRCAVELDEAGVRLKKSKTNSLKKIKFESGKFYLPFLMVDDTTECSLLNVITFEYLHFNLPPDVTIYVTVMDEIIDSADDVRLLHSKGLILNALGSDEEVARMFNSMGKEITMHHDDNLSEIRKNVSQYCRKRRHRWRAYLISTYFRNPWTIISLAGALLVIALTIVQTVYALFDS